MKGEGKDGILENAALLNSYFTNFLILVVRLGIILAFLPFFSGRQLPRQFKVGLTLVLGYMLAPVIPMQIRATDIPILLLQEVILGMTMGFAVRLIFWSVETAGIMISDAMGLSMATLLNPEIGQSTEVSTLLGLMAMLLFLAMDLHHDLIYLIVRSYEVVPVTQIHTEALLARAIALTGQLFVFAIKLAAPVLVGMLLINILMGFIYKAAPQMNIFFVSMPVHLFLGLLILALATPVMIHFLGVRFSAVAGEVNRIIFIAKG
jgi:flagellar biosynthesis protein FliR